MYQPQRSRTHWGRCPRGATTGARGWYDEHVALMAVDAGRWRPVLVLVFVYPVSVLWWILQAEVASHSSYEERLVWLLWPQGARGLCLGGLCIYRSRFAAGSNELCAPCICPCERARLDQGARVAEVDLVWISARVA